MSASSHRLLSITGGNPVNRHQPLFLTLANSHPRLTSPCAFVVENMYYQP